MSSEKENLPLLIGAHTSAAGGCFNALYEGKSIGATTIQFFSANQKRWTHKPYSEEALKKWKKGREETHLSHLMVHDSYLINLGSPREDVLDKSRIAFVNEIERCKQLGIDYLNFHPGAALKESRQLCLDRIIESLLGFESDMEESPTRLLLETTAGQGSTVGSAFEEIGYIVNRVKDKIPIGVCIDTCHIFAAGYDLSTTKACEETIAEFDQKVGLEHLYAFHLNDSLKECGSRVDRHKPLGEGEIGIDCFKFLMTDPRTKHLPKYLETPGGVELWKVEIEKLKSFALENN